MQTGCSRQAATYGAMLCAYRRAAATACHPAEAVVGSQKRCATLTMAEKTIFDPRASRAAEAQSRRLPFAPIFDTIVAEPLPKPLLTTEEPATKVVVKPDDGNGYHGPSLLRPEIRSKESASPRNRSLTWVLAATCVILVAGMVYQGIQLARQQQALSQLAAVTSKVDAKISENRILEQRPWVTISELIPQPLSTAPGAFSFSLQNAGKTPASNVKIAATAKLIDVADGSAVPAIEPVNRNAGTLFPGSQYRTVVDFHPAQEVFVALFRRQGKLEIHMNVSYEDAQTPHVTQSCWLWQPALRRMDPCSGFGTVN